MIKPALQHFGAREPADELLAEDAGDMATPFRLHIDDLILGKQAEIVIFNDSALPHIVIEAFQLPLERGEVKEHRTAEGVDVGGFCFLRFERGIVVFHDPDTRVIVELVSA